MSEETTAEAAARIRAERKQQKREDELGEFASLLVRLSEIGASISLKRDNHDRTLVLVKSTAYGLLAEVSTSTHDPEELLLSTATEAIRRFIAEATSAPTPATPQPRGLVPRTIPRDPVMPQHPPHPNMHPTVFTNTPHPFSPEGTVEESEADPALPAVSKPLRSAKAAMSSQKDDFGA